MYKKFKAKTKTFTTCYGDGGQPVPRVPELHAPALRQGPNPEGAKLLHEAPSREPHHRT